MPNILTSWKEIAQYVGKGVRTVQRWEREAGLPVRRQIQSAPHAVIAFPEELDSWARSRTRGPSVAFAEVFCREIASLRAENCGLSARLQQLEAAVLAKTTAGVGALGDAARAIREIHSAAQQCRADAIRARLSLASTFCALTVSRAGDGNLTALERAQRTALEIHKSLQSPGCVPPHELDELRALLMELASKIDSMARTVAGPGDAEFPAVQDHRAILQK